MEYLEQNRYVHRDLAARNVLVRNVEHVCVSDFGLTKMMQRDETAIIVGGKVAIKWLALECIRYKRFTCKSDVWAYGVTLWEILSYPSRPYDGVPINELAALLSSGERLPQPQCASLELYMLLIKCWMVDEQSRPSFGEIVNIFVTWRRKVDGVHTILDLSGHRQPLTSATELLDSFGDRRVRTPARTPIEGDDDSMVSYELKNVRS
jgi:serine/threonine protein kinase